MKRIASPSRPRRLATALASVGLAAHCAPAAAETIDLDDFVARQLAPRFAEVYQRTQGRPLPAGVAVQALQFVGRIEQGGIDWKIPPAIMREPDVVDTAYLCNDSQDPQHLTGEISGSTAITSAIANSDTLQTTTQVDLSIGLSIPPLDKIAAAGITKTRTETKQQTEVKASTATDGWKKQLLVESRPKSAKRIQLVTEKVSTRPLPFVANMRLGGEAVLSYAGGPSGFTWVEMIGSTPPPGTLLVPQNSPTWAKPGICRLNGLPGKMYGSTCYVSRPHSLIGAMTAYAQGGTQPGSRMEVLVGAPESMRLGTDKYAAPWDGSPGYPICLTTNGPELTPGYVMEAKCHFELNGNAYAHDTYQVLMAPVAGAATVRVRLEDWLGPEQRTVRLNGVYTGARSYNANAFVGDMDLRECKERIAGGGTPFQAGGLRALPPGVSAVRSARKEPFYPGVNAGPAEPMPVNLRPTAR